MNLFYLISAICFILGLKRLSHPKTARSGNFLAALGMLIAIAATLASSNVLDLKLIAIGVGINLFLYVSLNTSMVIGILPIVGLPLPLVSYGGSSMLATMIGISIVMSSKIYGKQPIS